MTAVLIGPSFALARSAPQPAARTAGAQEIAEIPQSARVQPIELARQLRSPSQPLILQVGFRVLYDEAHIPGSRYAGPASEASGLRNLREAVRGVNKNAAVVIYCGCCPWPHCPNIRPAYRALKSLGFTDVKALYIADNFGTDWVHKGYPSQGTVK